MNDKEFEQALELSYYKEIASLNDAHNIVLVQHTETSRTYVQKTLSLYNKDVYSELMSCPVSGVPKIFEIFEKDNKLIVIEEYISGVTLEKHLEEVGVLSENKVREYTCMLCDILTSLHSLVPPVIHRDIKPSNVILTDDNRLVLVDMNGAKQADSDKKQDTVLIGTQGYAAPEQYGFGSSSGQTDIFGVGMLMSRMLTGETGNIEKCPKSLRPIIKKCTEIDPTNRYISAEQLKNALKKSVSKALPNIAVLIIVLCIGSALIFAIIFFAKRGSISDKQNTSEVPSVTPSLNTTPTDTDVTPTSEPSPIATPTPTIVPSSTTIPSPSPEVISVDYTNPVGVYEGNDKEKLVIAENGLAYYYCSSVEYTEVQCPWTQSNDEITISLSVMHCDITASTKNGFKELIFKTKSLNWNTEVFEKVSNDAESAIINPPPASNKYVLLNEYGDKQFILDNILFTVPKQFRVGSVEDFSAISLGKNTFYKYGLDSKDFLVFLDCDAGESLYSEAFIAPIFIYKFSLQDIDKALQNPKDTVSEYTGGFLDKLQINYTDTVDIAGRNCTIVSINGILNSGFGGLMDYIMTGYIVLLPAQDNSGMIFIQMIQRAGMKIDDIPLFNQILENAKPYSTE